MSSRPEKSLSSPPELSIPEEWEAKWRDLLFLSGENPHNAIDITTLIFYDSFTLTKRLNR
jgi:hypothetical protein